MAEDAHQAGKAGAKQNGAGKRRRHCRYHSVLASRPAKIILILVLLGFGAPFGYYDWAIHRPLDFGERTWVIQRGDALRQIAAQLKHHDIITEDMSLRVLARVSGGGRQIRPGEYQFPPATSLREMLRRLINGSGQIGIKVTILEGWTFHQMRAHLRRAPKLKQTTAALSDQQLMAKLGYPTLHPEGRFFPDTYHYTAQQTDLAIYRQAFELMQDKLDFAWRNRADNLILKRQDEALIMASIIERESQLRAEQPRIAGVFHNRLQKGMRLQADPTVLYGLGPTHRGGLSRAHLKTDTTYNTYTRNGLTPTPISLPSAEALNAAVRPASTGEYYFVAAGSGGWHHFSVTLEQHNQAVSRYRRARKSGG